MKNNIRLPSMSSLQALVAIARMGYTTAAAESLNLTQSAVSKQLLSLEDYVGKPLFNRTQDGMIPTTAGEIFIEKAQVAIKAMEDAKLQVARLSPGRKALRIQILPILGDRWLLPKYADFMASNPDIDIQFTNFSSATQSEKPNAVFTFSEKPLDPENSICLFGEEVLLVASPTYWSSIGYIPNSFEELLKCTFLEHPGTPLFWSDYATFSGFREVSPKKIIQFGYYTMVIRAALSGQGVAMIPKQLIIDDIESKKLISLDSKFNYIGKHYYWYTPENNENSLEELNIFSNWVRKISIIDHHSTELRIK